MRPRVLLTRLGQVSQLGKLRLLGVLLLAIYGWLALVSVEFQFDEPLAGRPILTMLGLVAVASALYLLSLFVMARGEARAKGVAADQGDRARMSFRGVLGFSILFRLVLLFSFPIQEVDFYRYLWDGRVLWEGHNPYRFAPAQIDAGGTAGAGELDRLSRLSRKSDSIETIFSRVHHRQVATIYPPAAQVVFAACASVTPAAAPIWVHVLIWKCALIVVDVAILFAMRGLLRQVGMSEGWCVAYGWCPLAVKEVANSGHLDGLAVMWTLVALYLFVRASRQTRGDGMSPSVGWLFGGGCLGLAILSKTYPVVLLPLAAAFAVAHLRARALIPIVACLAVVLAAYQPFVDRRDAMDAGTEPLPKANAGLDGQRPWSGLRVFLTEWQMNDLLFMVVHENLRVPPEPSNRWFVLTPRDSREAINRRAAAWLADAGFGPQVDPAFVIAQALMGGLLAGLVLWWAWQVFKKPQAIVLLRNAFLVLAWSWLLASAQNPWYVLWFLPLMPFACARSWFLVPCLAAVYYLRFWMVYQGEITGGEIPAFDYGWVWFEHGIVLAALAAETWLRGRGASHSGEADGLGSTAAGGA